MDSLQTSTRDLSVFPFLKLPAELRNLIYGYIPFGHRGLNEYQGMLLSNKQIHQEMSSLIVKAVQKQITAIHELWNRAMPTPLQISSISFPADLVELKVSIPESLICRTYRSRLDERAYKQLRITFFSLLDRLADIPVCTLLMTMHADHDIDYTSPASEEQPLRFLEHFPCPILVEFVMGSLTSLTNSGPRFGREPSSIVARRVVWEWGTPDVHRHDILAAMFFTQYWGESKQQWDFQMQDWVGHTCWKLVDGAMVHCQVDGVLLGLTHICRAVWSRKV